MDTFKEKLVHMKVLQLLQSQKPFCLSSVWEFHAVSWDSPKDTMCPSTGCSILTFSEASCLRVESRPRRLFALIPDSDVCMINCVAKNCCKKTTLLGFSGKTSSVSACQLTITNHRLGMTGSEAVSVPCLLLRISSSIYLRSHKS